MLYTETEDFFRQRSIVKASAIKKFGNYVALIVSNMLQNTYFLL